MSAAPKLAEVAANPMATVRAWRRMKAAGFALSVESDKLIVTPASGLSDSQRAFLRSHKAALVELLSDAETLHRALVEAGTAGIWWREGTPTDWPDDRLLAAGEVLYADGRMVNRNERRYGPTSAPAIEIGPEYPPAAEAPEIASCAPTATVVPIDREAYEERAAIMEFDGGLPRDEAEQKALALAIRAQEPQAEGWEPWNATARACEAAAKAGDWARIVQLQQEQDRLEIQPPKTMTARELLALEFPPLRWLVEGVLPEVQREVWQAVVESTPVEAITAT